MPRSNHFHPASVNDLPEELAIFPLPSATLLPGTELPLNVFEPRYLEMVLDVMGKDRYLGMVQPLENAYNLRDKDLYSVGCMGRITTFKETEDGRLLISLLGICRFSVGVEREVDKEYRIIAPHWDEYGYDLQDTRNIEIDREHLRSILIAYSDTVGLEVDWDALFALNNRRIIDFLATQLPFSPEEKQALIEAFDAEQRYKLIMAAVEIAALGEIDAVAQ